MTHGIFDCALLEARPWQDLQVCLLQVMGVNGVSHHVVTDDLEGASAVLQWLSTMPPIIGAPPAHLPSSDPIERSITYAPTGSTF